MCCRCPPGAACRGVSRVLRDSCVGTAVTAVLCSGRGSCPGVALRVGSCGTRGPLLLCQPEPELLLSWASSP